IRKVARKFLDELDGQLVEKKVQLEVSPAALEWFVEHGYDKAMGARPMARLVQSTLKAPLANEILFGKLTGGGTARIDIVDGAIAITCESAPPAEDDAN
ncbi:MAG TPA: ATP-dependent Clp protease ATP-binding subunit ClpA, partial [Kofleriaceae bacterium]|nr:ATP-dependent Clp protease ATP-binding subunit ClpA [Kofleriaceae bacterium]